MIEKPFPIREQVFHYDKVLEQQLVANFFHVFRRVRQVAIIFGACIGCEVRVDA